jgi:hypothetical protein
MVQPARVRKSCAGKAHSTHAQADDGLRPRQFPTPGTSKLAAGPHRASRTWSSLRHVQAAGPPQPGCSASISTLPGWRESRVLKAVLVCLQCGELPAIVSSLLRALGVLEPCGYLPTRVYCRQEWISTTRHRRGPPCNRKPLGSTRCHLRMFDGETAGPTVCCPQPVTSRRGSDRYRCHPYSHLVAMT